MDRLKKEEKKDFERYSKQKINNLFFLQSLIRSIDWKKIVNGQCKHFIASVVFHSSFNSNRRNSRARLYIHFFSASPQQLFYVDIFFFFLYRRPSVKRFRTLAYASSKVCFSLPMWRIRIKGKKKNIISTYIYIYK